MADELKEVDLDVIGGRGYGKTTYLSYAFNVYNKKIRLKEEHWILPDTERVLEFEIDPGLDKRSAEYKKTEAIFRRAEDRQKGIGPDTSKTDEFTDMRVRVKYGGTPLFTLVLHDYAGYFGMGDDQLELGTMMANVRRSRYHMAFLPCTAFTSPPKPWADDITMTEVSQVKSNTRIIGQLYRVAVERPGFFFVNLTCSDGIYPNERQEVVNGALLNLVVNPDAERLEDAIVISDDMPLEVNFTACPQYGTGAPFDIDQPMIVLLACIMHDLVEDSKEEHPLIRPKTDRVIARALETLERKLRSNYNHDTRNLYDRFKAARIPQIDLGKL